MKTIPVRLQPWLDVRDLLDTEEVAGAGIGPEGDLHLVAKAPNGAFHALLNCSSDPRRFELGRLDLVVPFVQPLPDEEFVIVEAISEGEPNAFVFTGDGELRANHFVGDGIECVQTTRNGRIWISFYDEGIFGKGAPEGLICCDDRGRRLYSYDPAAAGTGSIADCYAMNVVSDSETWICFYTEFPVVRIRDSGAFFVDYTVWNGVQNLARELAVLDDHILIGGDSIFEHRRLGELQSKATIRFENEAGQPLHPSRTMSRGSALYFLVGTRCYRFDMRELHS